MTQVIAMDRLAEPQAEDSTGRRGVVGACDGAVGGAGGGLARENNTVRG